MFLWRPDANANCCVHALGRDTLLTETATLPLLPGTNSDCWERDREPDEGGDVLLIEPATLPSPCRSHALTTSLAWPTRFTRSGASVSSTLATAFPLLPEWLPEASANCRELDRDRRRRGGGRGGLRLRLLFLSVNFGTEFTHFVTLVLADAMGVRRIHGHRRFLTLLPPPQSPTSYQECEFAASTIAVVREAKV